MRDYRDMGKKGGTARAAKLSPAARRTQAARAASARWNPADGGSPPIDPRTVVLLRRVVAVFKRLRVPYAIGGGIAVIAHGVARNTSDVDAFVLARNRKKILGAVRRAGLTVDAAMDPFHYMAWDPSDNDLRIRVDILFSEEAREKFAVRHPAKVKVWGEEFNVFHPILLAAVKFATGEVRHRNDVRLMLDQGIVTAHTVRDALAVDDPALARSFVAWASRTPRRKKQNPRRHPLARR